MCVCVCVVALLDPVLSDYPRLSQQRKLIASVVVAGFDRVKIAGRRQQAGRQAKKKEAGKLPEPQLEFYRKFCA